MSKHTRPATIYSLLPMEVEGFDSLAELALDLRWSWNHAADDVWRQLDPALVGTHPQPLGCLADGLAESDRARVCRSRFPQARR